MSRLLSIDYGEKRVGVAMTDPLKMFVTPFLTIENKSEEILFSELLKIFNQHDIEKVIIGLPLSTEGKNTPKTLEVQAFFKKLSKKTDLPLVWWDERYTTCEANDFLKNKGLNWRKSRDVVDQIAAAMILKSYLDDFK